MRFTGLHPPPQSSTEALNSAIEHWVGDANQGQLGYYAQRSSDRLQQLRRTERLTQLCFAGGLLVAVILGVTNAWLADLPTNVLLALMGLLPLLAAGRQNYSHRLAERELVAQYAHMHEIFGHASTLLAASSDEAEQRQLLYELGEAALQENAQWLLRQRDRPLPGGEAMT